jgi:hypothetical protein
MANSVSITKILDGQRSAVFHVFIKSDGASGDLSDEVLIDPAVDFDPSPGGRPSITIDSLWYDLAGFDGYLEFDYLLSDTAVWSLSGGNGIRMDFCEFGGLKDRSNSLDGTGKLMLTTRGLSAGDTGTIILKVRKD